MFETTTVIAKGIGSDVHQADHQEDCCIATEYQDFQGMTIKTKTLDVRDMFIKQLTQIHSRLI